MNNQLKFIFCVALIGGFTIQFWLHYFVDIEVGQVWEICQKHPNPFVEKNCAQHTILEKKEGWIKYGTSRKSTSIFNFIKIANEVEDERKK